MKRILMVMLLAAICSMSFGQKRSKYPSPPKAPTAAEQKAVAYHDECVHRDTYTAKQRLRFYPFNKAAKVMLVSFYGMVFPWETPDTSAGPYLHRMGFDTVGKVKFPFGDNGVDTSALLEKKGLTKVEVNKLTDIFYNINMRNTPLPPGMLEIADPGAMCFNPRNAILFADAKGKIFAEIVICFECQKMEPSPENIKTGHWCEDKFAIFKSFFKSMGIRWGVTVKER